MACIVLESAAWRYPGISGRADGGHAFDSRIDQTVQVGRESIGGIPPVENARSQRRNQAIVGIEPHPRIENQARADHVYVIDHSATRVYFPRVSADVVVKDVVVLIVAVVAMH